MNAPADYPKEPNMVEQPLTWIHKYGATTVAAVVFGIALWQMFLRLETQMVEANAESKELIVQYHTTVLELGHDIEAILTKQQARDQAADLTRDEANKDRERGRELISLLISKVDRFEDWAGRAREIDTLRANYFAYYLNQDAVKQGMEEPFPSAEIEQLEAKLQLLLEASLQRNGGLLNENHN